MRRSFRIILLTLVLMIVAMISALTAMQLAIHGREVNIPRMVGLTPFEAERLAAASGLQLTVERQFYSAEIPEGKIMTQVPSPGTKVRRGWSIRVAQSLGPQRVAIPDVTGESERAAELNIKRRGLDVSFVSQASLPDVPQDRVASQSPPANASGIAAPKINLLVSEGAEPPSYVMPSLIGQPLGSATLTLQDAGMKIGKVTMVAQPSGASDQQITPAETAAPAPGTSAPPSQPGAASMIVTQTPQPGQKIVAGTAVNFEVR